MIEFAHPYVTPTLTVDIRNPELNDSLLVENRVQVRRAMNGDLRSFIRTPPTRRLLLTFVELSKPKVDELIAFLTTSAGTEIKYTDYDAVVWRGWIITDPAEFSTQGQKGNTCIEVSSLTIEFNGSKV